MSIILSDRLEKLLLANWAEYLNKNHLIQTVLSAVRDADLKEMEGRPVSTQMKISVTKFSISGNRFEVWVEFVVPQDKHVAIGTHVYLLSLDGNFELQKTYGVTFKKSDDV